MGLCAFEWILIVDYAILLCSSYRVIFSVDISVSSSKKGSKTWCSESGMSFVGTSLSTRKSIFSVAGVFFYVTFLSVCEVSLELEKFPLAFIVEPALFMFLCSLLICCFVCSACGLYGVIKGWIKVFFSLISPLRK